MVLDVQLLDVQAVTKKFPLTHGFFRKIVGYKTALDNVSINIAEKEVVGIVGESGSGKSTLAKIIAGLLSKDQGTLLFEGLPLDFSEHLKSREEFLKIRRQVQMVFQNPALSFNPRKTVGGSLEEVLSFHNMVENKKELHHTLYELLHVVGLDKATAFRYPHELSLGQLQRVSIARSLALQPKLLILDEAVSALDISVQAQILNLLQDLQEQKKMSYLFISHDLTVVEHIADRVYVMCDGKIIEEGSAEDILRAPKEAYTKRLIESSLT